MPSISKCFVLVSLALSVSALTTPHAIRNAPSPSPPLGLGRDPLLHCHSWSLSLFQGALPQLGLFVAGALAVAANLSRAILRTQALLPPANVGHVPPAVTTHHSSSPTHKSTHTSSADKPTSSKTSGGKVPSFMTGENTGQGKWIAFFRCMV